jgi:hypothetical protein
MRARKLEFPPAYLFLHKGVHIFIIMSFLYSVLLVGTVETAATHLHKDLQHSVSRHGTLLFIEQLQCSITLQSYRRNSGMDRCIRFGKG